MPDAASGHRETGLGQRLRGERLRRNLSQEELAEALGATVRSVRRWESGRAVPQPHYRAAYCRALGIPADDLFGAGDTPAPAVFLLPHARNPSFTGREDALAELNGALGPGRAVALCGIGGIGKTQVAVEHAYRVRDQLRAVLWVSADGSSDLAAGLAAAAGALGLPAASDANQAEVVAAVKRWLGTSADWLLVLDNVADPAAALASWLPIARYGRLLITCRSQATGGLAHAVPLAPMAPAEGADFVLRRARLATSAEHLAGVAEIAAAMGGLPLALDQTGAYLEETGSTPAQYLALYRERGLVLLARRGRVVIDHPDSVATTLQLSVDKLKQLHPEAAELLSRCAFLHPNDIPEDLFGSDPYRLAEAMASLRAFSLIQRNAERRTFSVHRLVQAVLRGGLPADRRRAAADPVVALMAGAFARVDDFATWAERHRLFAHALAAARIAYEWSIDTPGAAELLRGTGSYLQTLGELAEALQLLTRAAEVAGRAHGATSPELAECLISLGNVQLDMGLYEQAEPVLERALAIEEAARGPATLAVAKVLNELGMLSMRRGRYREGEAAWQRELAILEALPGPPSHGIGIVLNNLGGHAHMAGRYREAESYFRRSLEFRRRLLGPDHPIVATVLSNLGWLASDMDRLDEALSLLAQAERIYRLAFGPDHWKLAPMFHHRARVLRRLGDLEQASELLTEAAALWRRALGDEHPRLAPFVSTLACVRDDQGRFEEAEALHLRAIAIQERTAGGRHPELAASLHHLARHHELRGRRERALETYRRAYEIRCAALGAEHPDTAATRCALAALTPPAGAGSDPG